MADIAQFVDALGAHAQRHPARGAEQVAQHGDAVPRRLFEQQRRTFGTQGPVADFRHLEVGRHRYANMLELAHSLELSHKVPQI